MSEILKRQQTLIGTIASLKPQIQAALPKHINVDRMMRIAMTAVGVNNKLALCTQESFLGSLIIASQLGLEPNTPLGHCFLIPYDGKCTFQIGYKGIIELAYRSGLYRSIFAENVFPSDDFEIELGFTQTFKHKRNFPENGDPHIYYAAYLTKDEGKNFSAWGRARIEAHGKKYSKSYASKDGAWKNSFDSMAKKTVLIDVLKYAPKSTELQSAFAMDQATNTIDMEALKDGMLEIKTEFEKETPEAKGIDDLIMTEASMPK